MKPASASQQSAVKQRSVLVRALPPLGALVFPILFWSLACFVAGLIALIYARGWVLGPQALSVSLIYCLGAAMSVWPTAYFTRLLSTKRSWWRWVLVLVLLVGFTLLLTACLLALQHRIYYSQWHGEPFTRLWLWQQAFTGGAAIYTYVVLGLRLYVPVALIALVVTSWWLSRLAD